MDETTNSENKLPASDSKQYQNKLRWLRTTAKILAWTIATSLTLILILFCLIAWLLTPERLTPIVEQLANDNLNADVHIQKAELTIWKTFPYLEIDIEGLKINSHTFPQKNRNNLPANADSLLSLGKLHASINVAKIPLLQFDIKEINIDEPKINIIVDGEQSNLDILPPTGKEETSSSIIINSIILHKLHITNNRGISYYDCIGKTGFELTTRQWTLDYGKDGIYRVRISGTAGLDIPGIKRYFPLAINGMAKWDISSPGNFEIRQLDVNFADIHMSLSSAVTFADSIPTVNSLNLSIGPVFFRKLMPHIPKDLRYGLDVFETDFNISAKLSLAKPYKADGKTFPSFNAELNIPNCHVTNTRTGARINDMGIDASLAYNGNHPEKSRLTIRKVLLDGFGINLYLSGNASNLMKDPNVSAKISGTIDFAQMLKLIPQELPFRLAGSFHLDTDLKFALSDFSVNTFHKIKANGKASFYNIRYTVPKDSLLVFAKRSVLQFGTDSKFQTEEDVKNLLMTSFQVDTLVVADPGIRMATTGIQAGIGCIGSMQDIVDSTKITPLGARFKIGSLSMISIRDSSRIRFREMEANGSIRRYANNLRLPLMGFGINAGQIIYSDRLTFMSLDDGSIHLEANIKPLRESRKMMARIDSLRKIYPDIPRDTIIDRYRKHLIRRFANDSIQKASSDEYLDLSVDNEFKRIFRQWDMRGSISAKKGRLFTPFFPLRNQIDSIDMEFTTKEFNLHNLSYHAGKSDLTMKGRISNISSALLGNRRRPLTVDFKINSDTLDLNELMATAYKGNNFSILSGKEDFNLNEVKSEQQIDALIQSSTESTADTLTSAILIPKNLVVNINLHNRNATYSNMRLHDLRSSIKIKNGVLFVRDLSGRSNDGDIRLDLVYATADRHDIGTGMSLNMRDVRVGHFLQMIPGLDSIMPMLKSVDGVINARLLATTKVDSLMNVILPTTKAALSIDGKDLVLLDSETFRSIGKLLRFKNRERNIVDSLAVEATVFNSQLDVYPFILKMDRYKLGIVGWNDFETNYKYHISVLDSPLFFKFGINLSGNFMKDKMKFRLGKAKLKEDEVARTTLITDTTKRNLFSQMGEIFRRGAQAGLSVVSGQSIRRPATSNALDFNEKLTHSDSLKLIEKGIIERPDTTSTLSNPETPSKTDRNKRKSNKQRNQKDTDLQRQAGILPKQHNSYD